MGGVNPIQEVKNLGSSIDDRIIQPIVEDPVDAAIMATATYFGGPWGAAAAKTALELDEGKDLDEALTSGAKAGATVYVGQELMGSTGSDYNYDVEAQPGGFYGESSAPIYESSAALTPAEIEAQPVPGSGTQVYPVETPVYPTETPIYPGDYGTYVPGTDAGNTFVFDPNTGEMVPADTSVGFDISTEGNQFAFDPDTGEMIPVDTYQGQEIISGDAAQVADTATKTLSLKQAFDAARTVNSLLGGRQPTTGPQQPFQPQAMQPGVVDYSNYLSLLAMRPQQRSNSLI